MPGSRSSSIKILLNQRISGGICDARVYHYRTRAGAYLNNGEFNDEKYSA